MKSKYNLSRKQEEYIAEVMGGKRRRGSGRYPGLPADMISEDWLIEAKYRTGNFRILEKPFRKIAQEALRCGKKPALVLHFRIGDRLCHGYIFLPFFLLNERQQQRAATEEWPGVNNLPLRMARTQKSYGFRIGSDTKFRSDTRWLAVPFEAWRKGETPYCCSIK